MSGWGFLLKGENSLVATVSIAHVLFQAIALPNKAPGETVPGALFGSAWVVLRLVRPTAAFVDRVTPEFLKQTIS
jgi:hypothetical protein